MAADRKNWLVDLGTTLTYPLVYRDDNDNPVDLTGYTATMRITKIGDATTVYAEQTLSGTPEGAFTFVFEDEETATWTWVKGSYTIDLEDPDGSIIGLVFGVMNVRDRADVA